MAAVVFSRWDFGGDRDGGGAACGMEDGLGFPDGVSWLVLALRGKEEGRWMERKRWRGAHRELLPDMVQGPHV
jgi:hypothetical protein